MFSFRSGVLEQESSSKSTLNELLQHLQLRALVISGRWWVCVGHGGDDGRGSFGLFHVD